MLDLSPEKVMALMAIGLVVLGPQRLPHAARTLAQGLARARRLAETLTQPVHDSLAEPRQSAQAIMADLRDAIHDPARTLTSSGHPLAKPADGPPDKPGQAGPCADTGCDDFDPASN